MPFDESSDVFRLFELVTSAFAFGLKHNHMSAERTPAGGTIMTTYRDLPLLTAVVVRR